MTVEGVLKGLVRLISIGAFIVSSSLCVSLYRVKRQSANDNIGYSAHLEGDNHFQAVVHWTGHPSEDIFIVTRKVVSGHSTESWLWR